MELSEIRKNYVTALRNKPSITSERTVKSYLSVFERFCSDNSRIYRMSANELKAYMAKIRVEYSDSYYNVFGSVAKVVYEDVLIQPHKMKWFTPIHTYPKFHNIISPGEFIEMGKRCSNSKHKVIHVLLYSTGIRLSEMLNIKLDDIDYTSHRIFIKSAKKGKNRYVQLHPLLLKYLKIYFKQWKPKVYLLNGQKSLQYSSTSVQKIVSRISNGKYHPHSYRHTYLTNLIEYENVFKAKDLAGHSSLKSTLHYYHISIDNLNKTYNPLDSIRA